MSVLTRLFFSQSVVESVNTADRPSGETSNEPIRCIDCMSVAVIGRAASGEAASAAAATAKRSLGWVMPQA